MSVAIAGRGFNEECSSSLRLKTYVLHWGTGGVSGVWQGLGDAEGQVVWSERGPLGNPIPARAYPPATLPCCMPAAPFTSTAKPPTTLARYTLHRPHPTPYRIHQYGMQQLSCLGVVRA